MPDVKRRWRDYESENGARPIKKFLMEEVGDTDRAAIADAMAEVRSKGEHAGGARHLRGPIWEVRVDQPEKSYRILFASVGSRGRILLSLHAFVKKTQKTPKSWTFRGCRDGWQGSCLAAGILHG